MGTKNRGISQLFPDNELCCYEHWDEAIRPPASLTPEKFLFYKLKVSPTRKLPYTVLLNYIGQVIINFCLMELWFPSVAMIKDSDQKQPKGVNNLFGWCCWVTAYHQGSQAESWNRNYKRRLFSVLESHT